MSTYTRTYINWLTPPLGTEQTWHFQTHFLDKKYYIVSWFKFYVNWNWSIAILTKTFVTGSTGSWLTFAAVMKISSTWLLFHFSIIFHFQHNCQTLPMYRLGVFLGFFYRLGACGIAWGATDNNSALDEVLAWWLTDDRCTAKMWPFHTRIQFYKHRNSHCKR